MKKFIPTKTVLLPGVILLIAIASRTLGVGIFPGGIHVDEAFGGYEAWCILNYGTDSWEYSHPVYLTVWGSGMSVMNSILMIPFIKLWGLNTVTTRLPQIVVGILSVYVFYLLLKRIRDDCVAVWGMFFLAICPWHVMMSRWGIDCNLAPGFMLFAVYFFMRGLEKPKYLPVSALFWGLSLYCYVTIWILVPLILFCWGVYCMRHKKIVFSKYLAVSCAILFILALPLLLFVAVNVGWLPEIRTNFLSIPRLVDFRGDELGLKNLVENAKAVLKLFWWQNDGLIWNAIPYFGMYYLFTMPFIAAGFVVYISRAIRNIKEKAFGYELLILIWILVSVFTGILQGVNINKMNSIHFPMIILWTEGVVCLLGRMKAYAGKVIIGIYIVSFLCFEGYYFTEYQTIISERQLAGADQAIERALELREKEEMEAGRTIVVPNVLRHSHVLFWTEWPLDNYLETVQWQEYPARWLKTESFGCFEWIREEDTGKNKLEKNKIYLLTADEQERFVEEGWDVEMYEYVGVACWREG